ncbi:substrate-binding domain-containing protein [Cellulomonas triticagri]|jgi:ABC-type sugar transport system substrate-binding protein|uniref:Sugar ABC transporter substrate-binding protein n=1 Tax=Cellulomonas triticagri TaxID=2483352 RepID=A0A3M2J7W9_9CELL|nr:substrate-binding domain-containing protein [Cellulomonas triticagri]RMI09509.1 sugar ABC transporter substrate-binding protein [Cellulomonas triticagri]
MSSAAPKSRTLLLTAAAASVALGLAACSSGSSGSGTDATGDGGSGSGSTKVAAVIKGLDNPFFQAMEQGIDETAEADGVEVSVQAAADIGDTTGQADKLAALAGQDFGCFVVNPISGTNLVQALAPVGAAGTPVVNIDSPIDADAASAANLDIATYIGTDNEAAGGKAGDFVLANVDPGAQVAIIGGIAGDVTSAARVDGFKAAVGGDVDVIQEEAADWKRDIALTKATDILAANPDVSAFFAANDDMGLGIVKAVENAGKTGQVVVVSVDGNQDALQSVLDGGLSATVAQYPYAIGSLGVQACQVAAAGTELPAEIESPTALVDASVAQQAIDAFPQPFEEFDNPLTDLLP